MSIGELVESNYKLRREKEALLATNKALREALNPDIPE